MLRRIPHPGLLAGPLLAFSATLLMATSVAAELALTVEVAETGSAVVPDPSLADADGNPTDPPTG